MPTDVADFKDSFPNPSKRNVVCRIYPNRTRIRPINAKKVGNFAIYAVRAGELDVTVLREVFRALPSLKAKFCLALQLARFIPKTIEILVPALTLLRTVLIVIRFAAPVTFIELTLVILSVEQLKLALEGQSLLTAAAVEFAKTLCED